MSVKQKWVRFQDKWNRSLQKDKQQHFMLGLCLSIPTVAPAYFYGHTYAYISLIIGVLYGLLLEMYQSTTADRHVEANDAYATGFGFVIGWLIMVPIVEYFKLGILN